MLRGRGAREHGGEAGDGPGGMDGVHAEVLRALAGEAVERGRAGLAQPIAVRAVHDEHVHAPGDRRARLGARHGGHGRGRRRGGQAAPEAPSGDQAERGDERDDGRDPHDASRTRRLGQQRARAKGHEHLRHLLERVAARGVGVREHEPPEAHAVRPRGARPQVVVDRAPDDHGEGRIARERAGEQSGRPAELEHGHRDGEGDPQAHPPAQREGQARGHRGEASAPRRASPSGPSGPRPSGAAASRHSTG